MRVGSNEFYEIVAMFDRQHKHLRLDKEAKEWWTRGVIYQNGETNNLFLAYRQGVALGLAMQKT